jgi:uncharacterized heparinase superfamily protein
MTLYRFNLYNGIGFVPDEEGRELPDVEAARGEALKAARGIIADEVLQGRIDLNGRIEVLDGEGPPVLTVPFADAVVVTRAS